MIIEMTEDTNKKQPLTEANAKKEIMEMSDRIAKQLEASEDMSYEEMVEAYNRGELDNL